LPNGSLVSLADEEHAMRWIGARSVRVSRNLLLMVNLSLSLASSASAEYRTRQLTRALTRLEERLVVLERNAFRDPLTGLPNRTMLQDRIEHALAEAQRHRLTIAVLLLDLDGFKEINDRNGHEVGDQVLVSLAQRLRRTVRAGDAVARMGGDEFVILLDDLPSPAAVVELAGRILTAVDEPMVIGARELRETASIGVATSNGEGTVPELLRVADTMQYTAKRSGKARIVFDRDP
jgi:diguanylate cyclase (GGDEF)-like protein